ncbi:Thioredoxin reductase [Devosia enhydra]|uniref:Thioredoxin reductase n=1 Tax=Devosia enhydra TaxID=665118 RepID=A0A1K2HXT0_9HYPH|nr:NAD(P)/FAD-dependent oxidoreductase [Devosia enhydra]SFZ84204.1 Thioredoxin reductase [Devosia enhydra]
MPEIDDVLVVGGSFAGLSAALPLLRARRRVRIVDGGLPRNRYSPEAHTVFGFDGVAPHDMLATARRQAQAYPTLSCEQDLVVAAERQGEVFAVTLESGAVRRARRILLAHGVSDQFPDLPGFRECWGLTVLHCPYCHGYEHADRHWGVMIDPAFLEHVLPLYREWTGRITVFSNGRPMGPEAEAVIARFAIPVIAAPVTDLLHTDGVIAAVRTSDGARHAVDVLFAPPPVRPSSPLAERLGCALKAGPLGPFVEVDAMGATSVSGVFAAGDLANPMQSVAGALGSGALAGAALHRSLLGF